MVRCLAFPRAMRWRRCVPLCLAIAASISPLYLVPLREHVSSRHPHESLEDENDTETLEDEEVGGGAKRSEKSFFFYVYFLVERNDSWLMASKIP